MQKIYPLDKSHCPKERKIRKILQFKAEFFSFFSFIFWAMRRLHIFILKFPDFYLVGRFSALFIPHRFFFFFQITDPTVQCEL